MSSESNKRVWWKDAVVYQIWPASFKDSNGDGVGDLRGVIDSLDYIQSIGADIIWLSPIFESPQCDMGYDISNYENVHHVFGTLEDVDDLIASCHARKMRLLLDLVVNHTSDQHAWFQESRSSKDNPKRAWYHWRPPRYIDGARLPPNNWRSNFGGSSWCWDDKTQEYYLHLFTAQQPDLNWECEEMRGAIYESAIQFWLDRGIDGFRIDTITIYSKDPKFPDAPILDCSAQYQLGSCHYRNKLRNYDHVAEMNKETFSKYDTMTVGEYGPTYDTAQALEYCRKARRRIDMGFQFETVYLGYGASDKFKMTQFGLRNFRALHAKWQQFTEGTDGWGTVFLENHDLGRSVSRFGCDLPSHDHVDMSAKLLAMLQATATGTLFIYQGQEIGMTNCPTDWAVDDFRDVETTNYWAGMEGRASEQEKLATREGIAKIGRDNARTPVQWDDSAYAGFSSVKPWMKVHDNYKMVNIRRQQNDKSSILSFWKSVLLLRRKHIDLFAHGIYRDLEPGNSKVLIFTKSFEEQRSLVVLNFSCEPQVFVKPQSMATAKLLLSNIDCLDRQDVNLLPWEGRIYTL